MVRRLVVLAVMVVAVGLMFWAGVHNMRRRRLAMELAHSKISLAKSGDAATGVAQDAQGTKLMGKAAPEFTLVDLGGKKVSLADFKGHPVVLNFWATWCGPCRLEMPWFEEFYGRYKPQGLVVLGLSQDETDTPKAEIASAVKKIGVTYPILLPDFSVSKRYALEDYLPETFYLDKNGVVVEHTLGTPSKDELEAHVRKAMGL